MKMKLENNIVDYIKEHELDKIIEFDDNIHEESLYFAVKDDSKTPYPPEWSDLVFIHKMILDRKAICVLEFGIGYSSIVACHALAFNKQKHHDFVTKNIRQDNPFSLTSVDDSKIFINKCIENFPKHLKSFHRTLFSPSFHSTFNGRICTLYENLPNINPDIILLDGPSQHTPKGDIRGIHTRTRDRVPMSGDLLAIEHFLMPGTMIISDGKTANIRFLKTNFQRKWKHLTHNNGSIHTLELCEPPLGRYNRTQLEFCLGHDWIKHFE